MIPNSSCRLYSTFTKTSSAAMASVSFTPPPASQALVQGVPFGSADASDVEIAAKARYDAFDTPGNQDPNLCKALFHFPNGVVFWSSKMSIDTDGPAAPDDSRRLNGKQLDPDSGQTGTSFHLPNGQGDLPAEVTPYIVLPENAAENAPFHPDLSLGNLAVVIYKNQMTAAICGDIGPFHKIGEASICVHQELQPAAPDPCRRHRDPVTKFCTGIFDASIDDDVLFFVFPGSTLGDNFTLADLQTDPTTQSSPLRVAAFALFNQLKQSS